MRYLHAFLLSILFVSLLHPQGRHEPIRVCVPVLKNSSREHVNPTWQRNLLIKAFERINKSKDVKKGKAAPVQAIALDSTEEPDPDVRDVRDNECEFVLHTDLIEVQHMGDHKISVPPPGAIEVGTTGGDPRAVPEDYRSATVEYRITRAGNPATWASSQVSEEGQVSEETLVSQVMDQVANRVAAEFQKPHPPAPQ